MEINEQPIHQYFYQYAIFQRIGINLEDVEDSDIRDIHIEGDFDIGININRGKRVSIVGATIIGGGTGIKAGGERPLPPQIQELIVRIGEHRTEGFSNHQVEQIISILDDIKTEIVERTIPDETMIQRNLRYLAAFFENSANILTVITALSTFFGGNALSN